MKFTSCRPHMRWTTIGIACLFALGLVSCGLSQDDSKKEASGSGSDDLTSFDSLSAAVPGGLQLAVFPQEDGGAGLGLQDQSPESQNDEELKKPLKEKVEENRQRLMGTAAECFSAGALGANAQVEQTSCYNFDSDMKVSVKSNAANDQHYGTKDGTLGGAIAGQVGSRDPAEACLVSKARELVSDVVLRVDQAMAMASGLVCVAKKAKKDRALGVNDELTLKDDMNQQLTGKGVTILAAKIRRVGDNDNARVFVTRVLFQDPAGETHLMRLLNGTSENGDQRGVLSFHRGRGAGGALQGGSQGDKNQVMSIRYHKTTEGDKERMRAEARMAAISKDIAPFDAVGNLNYAAIPESGGNNLVENNVLVAFDMFPDTNEGTLSYFQNPGGMFTEAARGFLFNMSADDAGLLSGCAVSGAVRDTSIRKALTLSSGLAPDYYWHPNATDNTYTPTSDIDARYEDNSTGGGNSHSGAYVTKQCFKQNSEGVYAIDTAETTHDRGYDLVQTGQSQVQPPERPNRQFKPEISGDFE